MYPSRTVQSQLFLLANFIFLVASQNTKLNKCVGASLNPKSDILKIPYYDMEKNKTTTFTLVQKTPKCTLEMVSTVDRSIKFTEFGEILVDNDYYSVDEYCIHSTNNGNLEIRHCKINCGESHVCIPKCCSVSEVLNLSPLHCSQPDENYGKWTPTVYNKDGYRKCGKKEEGWKFHYRFEELQCNEGMHLYFRKTTLFGEELEKGYLMRILTNGTVTNYHGQEKWQPLAEGTFCLDRLQNYDNISYFSRDADDYVVMYCIPDSVENSTAAEMENTVSLPNAFAGVMIFSSLFSMATAVVYLLLWDKHNIHGWTIFCFNLSMLLMFIFLATAHLTTLNYDNTDSGSPRCHFIGFMTHFFFLAMFCFMTMINFDLFITFKRLSPTTTKSQQLQRFGFYLLFGLGIPFIIVVISLILDQSLKPKLFASQYFECESELDEGIIRPEYGVDSCYLSENSRGYYLYAPIGFLLGCNFILFSSTVYSLWKYKQTTKTALKGNSKTQKQSFIIFVKLFFIMGISWIAEVLSWAVNKHNSFWLIFDLINLLSPLAIFFIFVCKREIAVMLYQKYPSLRRILKSGLPCCRIGLMDTEATDMTGIEKSKVHYRNSASSGN